MRDGKVRNLQIAIKDLKRELLVDLYDKDKKFNDYINKLINNTPSGQIRNSLTNINILHQELMRIYDDLLTLKD
jgi:hypothetical protein